MSCIQLKKDETVHLSDLEFDEYDDPEDINMFIREYTHSLPLMYYAIISTREDDGGRMGIVIFDTSDRNHRIVWLDDLIVSILGDDATQEQKRDLANVCGLSYTHQMNIHHQIRHIRSCLGNVIDDEELEDIRDQLEHLEKLLNLKELKL